MRIGGGAPVVIGGLGPRTGRWCPPTSSAPPLMAMRAENLVAYDAANGTPVWHSRIGSVSNAPTTFMLDGRQYILAAAGDTLYAFAIYE
jgi:hypothetical protein